MLPYRKENKLLARELRNHATEAERLLWERLRRKQILNAPFYRQKTLANFIVDFYCAAAQLVIELDGSQHYAPNALVYDVERTRILEAMGLLVLRFDNRQVMQELDAVVQVIAEAVRGRLNPF
ncbi:endonuclease domain-containing protein [Chromatium okenii]|uniref:endonuclease domain-containing protein n=1 Tax=Chromatium okenii TaxID=61644 RepID=UPI0026F218D3|nr:endonuclease domain-containing protein [Chromatium okenii]MBV5310674.1 endonuclease domain-containing protein [Chromatium okenii]